MTTAIFCKFLHIFKRLLYIRPVSRYLVCDGFILLSHSEAADLLLKEKMNRGLRTTAPYMIKPAVTLSVF